MKTFKELLEKEDRRKNKRKHEKESLKDYYVIKSVEKMLSNIEKEKRKLPDGKEIKIIQNMIDRVINDIKFELEK